MESEESEYDYLIPVIMVGDRGVGKASLQSRFTNTDNSHLDTHSSGEDDFKVGTLKLGGKTVKLQIWNLINQGTISNYRGKRGAFAIYDVTDEESFKNVAFWVQEISKYGMPNLCMILGNKSDLVAKRAVSTDKAKEYADSMGMLFFETSAKEGTNVELALTTMVTEIIKRRSYILPNSEPNVAPSPSKVKAKPIKKKRCTIL